MDNFNVLPLWATPIYTSSVNVDSSIKDKLKNLHYVRMAENNAHYTENKTVLNLSEFSSLKSSLMEHVVNYASNIIEVADNVEWYFTTSWVVRHQKQDWAQSHLHCNSIISGVYYIEVDDDSGSFVFDKDSSLLNLFTPTVDVDVKKWNVFNSRNWAIKPKNDMVIMFPSQIKHFVTPSNSDNLRYCLSFNLFVRGTIAKEISELHLL